MEREQLEEKIEEGLEKELLGVIDSVCKGAFITNRNRLQLVKDLVTFIENREH